MRDFEIDKDFKVKISSKKPKILSKNNFLLAKYFNIGYYIVTPLLLGVFLGLVADYYLKTKPLFTALFLLLGTVSAFYNLYKIVKDGQRTSY